MIQEKDIRSRTRDEMVAADYLHRNAMATGKQLKSSTHM